MAGPTPSITVSVDLTNPGQFFACCGLLELADRLWPGAEGWFDESNFYVGNSGSLTDLLTVVSGCRLIAFDPVNRGSSPLLFDSPFEIRIDWYVDDLSGGSRFKTWAGQQAVLEIARSMHGAIDRAGDIWEICRGTGLPFNFDSTLGSQGSALDIGFSFDPLAGSALTRIAGSCRPVLEFLAFVGLQRFRPGADQLNSRFVFATWRQPLIVSVAAVAASGVVSTLSSSRFTFPLLYRTKYLKSFLPASAQGSCDD